MSHESNMPSDGQVFENVSAYLVQLYDDKREEAVDKLMAVSGCSTADELEKEGYKLFDDERTPEGGELLHHIILLVRGKKPLAAFRTRLYTDDKGDIKTELKGLKREEINKTYFNQEEK